MTMILDKLAIDGGTPVRTESFPPWPFFDDAERTAALEVLASGKVNQWTGDQVRLFEHEYAKMLGAPHAIALMNGTVALELALMAFDIGPGDEVIVPARTFVATASAAVMRGAIPIVADVDPLTQGLSPATVAPLITDRTKAIIPVHLAGWPCDMPGLIGLAEPRGIVVIEDCAQAHGATLDGRDVGTFGHAAAFSFCQDKIMTTGGEGGLLVLHDEERFRRAWAFKDHGKSYAAVFERDHPPGFRWLHDSFGTNWRMTEFQAAIGRCQLGKLSDWISSRRKNAVRLDRGLRDVAGLRVVELPDNVGHARYKYYTFLDCDTLKDDWNQERVITAINAEGIPCFSGSCSEIYLERAFTDAGLGPAQRFVNTRRLGEESIMLLIHPTLSDGDMDDAVKAVRKVMSEAVR